MSFRYYALGLLVAMGLTACGSGGDPDSPPISSLTYLTYVPEQSGYVYSDGTRVTVPDGLTVGDLTDNSYLLSFLRFSIDRIPAGHIVTRAELELRPTNYQGSPWGELGPFIVDYVDVGTRLDVGDLAATAIVSAIDVVAINPGGLLVIDVAQAVSAALGAGKQFIDLRLRLATPTNGDLGADFVTMDATWVPGIDSPMQTIVWYETP